MRDLADRALDAARGAGASYADIRLIRTRRQRVETEDLRVSGVLDAEEIGYGVRVVADGAWGFAGAADLTREGVARTAREAVAVARASALVRAARPVALAPEEVHVAAFKPPVTVDPFAVPISDKANLLVKIGETLRANPAVRKAEGWILAKREEKLFASTEGSWIDIDVFTTACGYTATAVANDDCKTRSFEPPPRTQGYENIPVETLLAEAPRVAEQAVQKCFARETPVGPKDLILDPLNLALTIHESVGHATELDRVLGMEESLAGRSFATPDKLGRFRYGSPLVHFMADNTLPGGLASFGFDDDGVPAQRWAIVEEGILRGYSTSREVAPLIGQNRSRGGNRADHWGSIPIVRIPNLSLMPGRETLSLADLIADTEDGIYIEGMGSFSIDQMRLNFQFGGDCFWEVKRGKIVGMLKNVTYQSITPRFWGSCDAICDERFWVPHGVLNCGKGDPMQVAQMTHGAAPARFRGVDVGGASARMRSYRQPS